MDWFINGKPDIKMDDLGVLYPHLWKPTQKNTQHRKTFENAETKTHLPKRLTAVSETNVTGFFLVLLSRMTEVTAGASLA